MLDEGYIKFKPTWTRQPALIDSQVIEQLTHWRQVLYHHGLIGAYENGIGYGNISQRYGDTFIISGSKTGNIPILTAKDYALVSHVDIKNNRLTCIGETIASSESMSHAVIYQELAQINAVIHIHHLGLWEKLLFNIPTTASGATYGTPEMAQSIIELIRTTSLPKSKVFVMQEHREGIFAFGDSLQEAATLLLEMF